MSLKAVIAAAEAEIWTMANTGVEMREAIDMLKLLEPSATWIEVKIRRGGIEGEEDVQLPGGSVGNRQMVGFLRKFFLRRLAAASAR